MSQTRAESASILLYHHVSNDTPPSTSTSPADFKSHLDYLQENDFSVLPLTELISKLRSNREIADKTAVITFDDGYESIYDTAFPMLQEYGYPFTVFISTGPIDRKQSNFMSWDEIRTLSDAGVVIANHLVEHPHMVEIHNFESEQQWLNRLRSEIQTAEERIKEETGQNHEFLAYPYGEFDDRIKQLLNSMNYVGFAQNSGAVNANSDFLALPRFPLASIYARISTASTKMESKAFDVTLIEPSTPISDNKMPKARLQFGPGNYDLNRMNCFYNGEPLDLNWIDRASGILEIQSDRASESRRWRYICTAPDNESSRFFWTSVQWINPSKPLD